MSMWGKICKQHFNLLKSLPFKAKLSKRSIDDIEDISKLMWLQKRRKVMVNWSFEYSKVWFYSSNDIQVKVKLCFILV